MTILEKIQEIVNKYYCSSDDCIKRIRYDKDDNEFWIEKEIEDALIDYDGDVEIKVVDIYSSCSYEVDILIVAYHDEYGALKIFTQKLELH